MKPWIKRTLIGLVSLGALFGGLAAWGQHAHHRWHSMSTEEAATLRARMVDRAARYLELDAAQKAKLTLLGDKLHAQRLTLAGSGGDPRAELQAVIAGTAFDRTRASALLESKLSAVHVGAPEVINALADFYDSLRPEQQAMLRDRLAKGRHGWHG